MEENATFLWIPILRNCIWLSTKCFQAGKKRQRHVWPTCFKPSKICFLPNCLRKSVSLHNMVYNEALSYQNYKNYLFDKKEQKWRNVQLYIRTSTRTLKSQYFVSWTWIWLLTFSFNASQAVVHAQANQPHLNANFLNYKHL